MALDQDPSWGGDVSQSKARITIYSLFAICVIGRVAFRSTRCVKFTIAEHAACISRMTVSAIGQDIAMASEVASAQLF